MKPGKIIFQALFYVPGIIVIITAIFTLLGLDTKTSVTIACIAAIVGIYRSNYNEMEKGGKTHEND